MDHDRQMPAAESDGLEPRIILSFDVEEHYRIEAAAGLTIDSALKMHYRKRLQPTLDWLLEQLDQLAIKATFFFVGQIARREAKLIRAIHAAGHEIASHGWDHRRLHHLTAKTFREDVTWSRDALEQAAGGEVIGYRAPTFSIVPQTSWAIDVLAEMGVTYDSSIYPVRHDRYGVPRAPRAPFMARGVSAAILELPPTTLRLFGTNLPVGGGGYFRLLPPFMLEAGLRQVARRCNPPIAMLYFHPWEFDPNQARLPLGRVSQFRTYVGLARSRERFVRLLSRHRFARAVDVAKELDQKRQLLKRFQVGAPVTVGRPVVENDAAINGAQPTSIPSPQVLA